MQRFWIHQPVENFKIDQEKLSLKLYAGVMGSLYEVVNVASLIGGAVLFLSENICEHIPMLV